MWKLTLFLVIIYQVSSSPAPQQYRERESRVPLERYSQLSSRARELKANPPQDLFFVLSANNLRLKDGSKLPPDAYVKVHSGILPKNGYQQSQYLGDLGRTETRKNETDPKWVKVFEVKYTKGTHQKLYVDVRDQYDDSLGDAIVDLDEYIEYGHQLTVPLKDSKEATITIQNTAPFSFSLSLKKIPALDGFGGLSDPYVKCYFRFGKDGRDYWFHDSSTLDNTNSAKWDNAIRFQNFIRGTDQMIHFVVKDSDSTSADDDIGDALLDVDAFVDKKQTSVLKISKDSDATLYVNFIPDKQTPSEF